jgi:hypothetical protein
MDPISLWFEALLTKIAIYLTIYAIALAICLVYAIVIYFTSDHIELSAETLTTNGVYVLKSSFFQKFEDVIFGNISSILSSIRKAIIFNNTFRALTILVAVLAVVLMGFTMLIGDQKITIKEFFFDILIIFGSASILLYYDPTLSVEPNAVVRPEKYITLLYNFLQSISNFISKMLFGTVSDVMKIQYQDGTVVGYYAPIDVVASLFFDDTIAFRFKIKLAALICSPVFIFIPLLLLVLLYYLVPCVLTVFIAILLAKTTIMFAIQFLPFFILFSSINDVKIKISKKAKGMGLSMKLIVEGIAQPMLFLALTSFLAGFLLYIFVISNLNDIFNFRTVNRDVFQMPNFAECFECDWLSWDALWCAIKLAICLAENLLKMIVFAALNAVFPPLNQAEGLSFDTFFWGLMKLWIGIVAFKYTFGKISPIMVNLIGGSAASDLFTKGEGIYDTKKNSVGQLVQQGQDVADDVIKKSTGIDVNESLLSTDVKSNLADGMLTNPAGLLDKQYQDTTDKIKAINENTLNKKKK